MTKQLAGLRVLIVEDHADSADVIELALTFDGADTRSTPDAEAALQLVTRFPPTEDMSAFSGVMLKPVDLDLLAHTIARYRPSACT